MVYPESQGIAIMGAATWGTSITDNSDDWNNAVDSLRLLLQRVVTLEGDTLLLAAGTGITLTERNDSLIISGTASFDSTYLHDRIDSLVTRVTVLEDSVANYDLRLDYLLAQVESLWDSLGSTAPEVDQTPPVVNSIELGDYNDSIAVAIVSEEINTDSIPQSAWLLETGGSVEIGIDTVYANADSLFFALDSALASTYSDSTLFMTYTKPATYTVEDTTGNEMASFQDSTVTNNITPDVPFDDGMLNNGDFSDGSTGWTTENGSFTIADGVATFDDVASSYIRQADTDMETAMTTSTTYSVSFDLNLITATSVNLSIRDDLDAELEAANYTTSGNKTIEFTTTAFGGPGVGFQITISSSSDGTCSIDNISVTTVE